MAGLNYGPFHFTSNHASNYLPLKGTLPDDREKFLQMIDDALGGKQRTPQRKVPGTVTLSIKEKRAAFRREYGRWRVVASETGCVLSPGRTVGNLADGYHG